MRPIIIVGMSLLMCSFIAMTTPDTTKKFGDSQRVVANVINQKSISAQESAKFDFTNSRDCKRARALYGKLTKEQALILLLKAQQDIGRIKFPVIHQKENHE